MYLDVCISIPSHLLPDSCLSHLHLSTRNQYCIVVRQATLLKITMASTGNTPSHSNSGPSSEPATTSNRLTYANALRSGSQSNTQPKESNESHQALLQSQKPMSAAQRVFAITELLEMIMVEVPLSKDRSALSVSRKFWAVMNPDAERQYYRITRALGLEFSRSLESMTESEKKDLEYVTVMPVVRSTPQKPSPRMDWLLNIEIDRECLLGSHAPFMKIKPFVLDGIKGHLSQPDKFFHINFHLDAADVDRRYTEWKGVAQRKDGQEKLWSNGNLVSRNWMDVKLAKMPFKVSLSVNIDFRKVMGAPTHPEGPCSMQGCQVGLYGCQVRPFSDLDLVDDDTSMHRLADQTPQYTNIIIEPEKATLGAVVAFLDRVENEVRQLVRHMAYCSAEYGPGPTGAPYYLCMYDTYSGSRLVSSALMLTHRHRFRSATADDNVALLRRSHLCPQGLPQSAEQPGVRAGGPSQDKEFRL